MDLGRHLVALHEVEVSLRRPLTGDDVLSYADAHGVDATDLALAFFGSVAPDGRRQGQCARAWAVESFVSATPKSPHLAPAPPGTPGR